MRIEIKQESKDLFEAVFTIYSLGKKVGSAQVRGSIKSPESDVIINIDNDEIRLFRINRVGDKHAYRPYSILLNEIPRGSVFQTEKKTSFLKSYGFQKAFIDGIEYVMYPIGFGEDGIKNPIYIGEKQSALLVKQAEIVNDLHHFDILLDSYNNKVPAIIFGFYIYVKAFFKPGEKPKASKERFITITTEKELLEKYKPEFEEQYS